MSTCDNCRDPGACCRAVRLNSGAFPTSPIPLFALVELASAVDVGFDPDAPAYGVGLPFMPMHWSDDRGWTLWCPNLLSNGRCGDYGGRPFACRDYQPGADAICVEYRGAT